MKALRWSDNDRYFGPFTYTAGDYPRLALVLGSGDGDDYPGCRLRLSLGTRTLIVALPPIIKPEARKVEVSQWRSDGTADRLGRDFYYDYSEREYGFSYSEGFLQVFRGAHTMDSSTDRTWSKFLPWTQWRHVRHSVYGLGGELFAHLPQGRFLDNYAATKALEEACPSASFAFADYDGEHLTVRTRIEEREWRFGTGSFKWLSLFRKPKIGRSLDLWFSGETGKRKGSWKGGTLGHNIEMLTGELHEHAFRRYCDQHQMTFLASVDTHPKGGDGEAAPAPLSSAVGEAETSKRCIP